MRRAPLRTGRAVSEWCSRRKVSRRALNGRAMRTRIAVSIAVIAAAGAAAAGLVAVGLLPRSERARHSAGNRLDLRLLPRCAAARHPAARRLARLVRADGDDPDAVSGRLLRCVAPARRRCRTTCSGCCAITNRRRPSACLRRSAGPHPMPRDSRGGRWRPIFPALHRRSPTCGWSTSNGDGPLEVVASDMREGVLLRGNPMQPTQDST